MSISLEIVCTNQQTAMLDRSENTIRMIGEILPLVIARYGIEPINRDPNFTPESEPIAVG